MSPSYNKEIKRGNWGTSFIWGRNHENHGPREIFNLNGYTAESTVNFLERNYLFTRLELVDITFYSKPSTLDSIYGNNPVSWRLFVRLHPAKMKMDKHAMHDVHK